MKKLKKDKRIMALALFVVLSLAALPGCGMAGSAAALLSAAPVRADTSAPVDVEAATPVPAAPADLAAIEGALGRIYQDVGPSVVYIEVLQQQAAGMGQAWPFFGDQAPQLPPSDQYQRGSGSGFVWDDSGYIVTNNHVVEGADKIKVTFSDGTTVIGTLVGSDADSDLAVVKVDVSAEELYPVQLADSTQVKVGELAVAIGNSFGLESTMTVGIVSALGRSLPVENGTATGGSYTIPDMIQTDAPINPGNSGGVLVDDQGKVIGVTSAIISPVRASAGIGFAIPSVIVQKVIPALIEDGHYAHPWLGISGTDLDSELAQAMHLEADQRGALVVDVVRGGPADEAGLRGSAETVTVDGQERRVGGDVIVRIGGENVARFDDLVAYLVRATDVGQTVTVTVLRDDGERQVQVTLGERPASESPVSERVTRPGGDEQAETAGAWLGITGMTLSSELSQAMGLPEEQQGVLIAGVVNSSPADLAGLRGGDRPVTVDGQQVLVGGDVIVAWDGSSVTHLEELQSLVREGHSGQEVTATVVRDGEQIDVQVTLEQRPTS